MKHRYVLLVVLTIVLTGCKMITGPDKTGEYLLSSERVLGTSTYYQFGYSYENSEFSRFPYEKDPVPDIINEGFRVLVGDGTIELPGFHTPGEANGFAKVGEFESLSEARSYYDEYKEVEANLQFVVQSDTVEAFQVWVQLTSAGNYVKLLVKETASLEGEGGNKYSEALMEYTYQPDGSTEFPD